MWRHLSIRNFRSIAQAEVTLGRFNVLVGRNSVGKSNLADALAFFSEMTSQPDLALTRRGGVGGVLRWRAGGPAALEMRLSAAESAAALRDSPVSPRGDSRGEKTGSRACHGFRLSSRRPPSWEIERQWVSLRGPGMELELEIHDGKLQGELDFPLPELEPTASVIPYLQGLRHYAPALRPFQAVRRYRLSPRAMSVPAAISEKTTLAEDGGNVATAVGHLRELPASGEASRWPSVLAGMQRIIPGLVDIEMEAIDRYHRLVFRQALEPERPARFSAAEVSDGALQALGILVAAAQVDEGDLLIVEEPESHLHPGAAQIVFEQLEDAAERGAVLLTTHSPELVDAARDQSILVCQYENSRTLVGPLAESQRALIHDGLFTAAELIRSEDLRIDGREVESITPVRAVS